MEEKKYLDVLMKNWLDNNLFIDEGIEEGLRIILKSPTGSGKNYFTQHALVDFTKKSIRRAGYKKILFITSRAITANQYKNQLIEEYRNEDFKGTIGRIGGNRYECEMGLEFDDWKSADIIYGHKWDVEKNLLELCEMEEEGQFLFIVVDEIHGLSSDDFTTASPATLDLIEGARKDTNMILMSAIPERVLTGYNFKDYSILDFGEEAIKVEPKIVKIIQSKTAYSLLEKAQEDNKILYFVETTKKAYEKELELLGKGVRAVAITSKPENRKEVYEGAGAENELLEKQRNLSGMTLSYIETEERFPDNIDLIIATSKLREGANIKDRRNRKVITELRDSVSLIQGAGRNRFGVEEFLIVDGAKQNISRDYRENYKWAKENIPHEQEILSSILNELERYKVTPYDEYTLSIEEIGEKKRRYRKTKVQFNEFLESLNKKYEGLLYYSKRTNKIKVNSLYYQEQQRKWKDLLDCKESIKEYVEKVFQRDNVVYNDLAGDLEGLLVGYIGKSIGAQERKELIQRLNERLPKSKEIKSKINTVIEKYGFTCVMMSDKRHYKIELCQEIQKEETI